MSHSALLDPHLEEQVSSILASLSKINGHRALPRLHFDQELLFLDSMAQRYLTTRKERAVDLERDIFSQAIGLANSILLFPVYRVLCVDGRIHPPLLAGLITGGSVRVPAGSLPDFIQAETSDKLFLPDDAYFAELLTQAFAGNDTIVEILDAHRGCAAAKEKAMLRTGGARDGGLLLNVQRQLGIKAAIEEWVERYNVKTGAHKRAVVVHISSNPADPAGGFIIGLRKDACVAEARSRGGFTPEVLASLEEQGETISTNQLVSTEPFASALAQVATSHSLHSIDWGGSYAQSALVFWQAMDDLLKVPKLIQTTRDILVKVLPYLETDTLKLDVHAKILIAGVLSTYLQSQAKYTEHRERVCVITRHAERGPFSSDMDMDSFTIFALDKDIHHHVQLTLNLMRSIRQKLLHPVFAEAATEESVQNAYIAAPGIFFVQEVLREDLDWSELEKTDWSDLAGIDWMTMSTYGFLSYIKNKNISLPFALAIEDLRQIVARLYNPAHVTSRLLMEGDMVVFPVLAGKYRRPRIVVPFILGGYK